MIGFNATAGVYSDVTGPLTNDQLRQSPVPVSAVALPLPGGAATETTLSAFESANHTDLSAVNSTLGLPFQVGGSIGNSSFGISGNLPSFASTPTFNFGTLNGAATDAELAVLNGTLGIPMQNSGGSVTANAGTNLDTSALNLESTQSAFKSANHTDLLSVVSTIGTPMQQSGGSVTANAGTNLNTSLLSLESTQSAFKTANHTDLGTLNTTLGSPFQSGGSIGNTTFACTQSGTFTVQPGNTANTTAWKIDGSAVTQPISAVALPLPLGATTETTVGAFKTANHIDLGTLNSTLGSPFQSGGSIGNSSFGISGTLPAFAATPTVNLGTIGTAATAANQAAGNASLSSIDGKAPALGQALAAGSIPVVLTAAQISTLTPLSSVSVSNFPASQAVTGTFWQATQPVSGTFYQATQPVSIASMPSTPVTGTFWQSTQPVSIAAAPVLVAGSAIIGKVGIDQTTPGTTNGVQINAGSAVIGHVIVDTAPTTAVTGTFWQSTQPVSIATAPALVASSAVIGHVIVDTAPSTAVTNTGTFAVQATIGAGSAVIGHVVADSGSTTAVTGNVASTVADGANVTLGAKADAKSTATDTTAITIMSVLKEISAMEQAPASRAVTNVGTFATQSTLAAETTKVIGTVNISSAQTVGIAAGSAVIGHTINDSGSTTAVTGNVATTIADGADVVLGAKADAKSTATDTTSISIMSVLKEISAMLQAPPSQAVTNTGTFAVQAASTLASETTKVIGTVNVASAQTIGLAAGSAVIGHVIVDTAPTTAVTIAGSNPCNYAGATLVSITGATSTNNATQIIALSGSTKIYICSLTVIGVSGTTPAFGLVSGTGSNCASSQTTVLQAFGTTANQLYAFANPVAVTTAAHALCYKDTGTSPVENYSLTYVQQ